MRDIKQVRFVPNVGINVSYPSHGYNNDYIFIRHKVRNTILGVRHGLHTFNAGSVFIVTNNEYDNDKSSYYRLSGNNGCLNKCKYIL